MNLPLWRKRIIIFLTLILICSNSFANADLYKQARQLQREGKYGEAIEGFNNYLLQPISGSNLSSQQVAIYTEALVQADKDFSELVYTNRNHSIFGGNTRNHLFRQAIRFFDANMK
jgi:dipeptidyl-peptidase-4